MFQLHPIHNIRIIQHNASLDIGSNCHPILSTENIFHEQVKKSNSAQVPNEDFVSKYLFIRLKACLNNVHMCILCYVKDNKHANRSKTNQIRGVNSKI